MTDKIEQLDLSLAHSDNALPGQHDAPTHGLPLNFADDVQNSFEKPSDVSGALDYSYFDDNTEPQDATRAADTDQVMSGGLDYSTTHQLSPEAFDARPPAAYGGEVTNMSEIGVVPATHDITANINNASNLTLPPSPWTVPVEGSQSIAGPQHPRMELPHIKTEFTTPVRSTPLTPATALRNQEMPAGGRKKRKIGHQPPTYPPYPSLLPSPATALSLATPIQQQPPTPGMFGAQARGIRSGRQATVQPDHLLSPTDQVMLQLQGIPQLLSGGMQNLVRQVGHLAQEHNALKERVYALEFENRVLKDQTMPTLPPQQAHGSVGDETLRRQIMTPESTTKKQRSRNATPLPGEAYGGPLFKATPKGSGMLSGIGSIGQASGAMRSNSVQGGGGSAGGGSRPSSSNGFRPPPTMSGYSWDK